jgi:hypothetical protein
MVSITPAECAILSFQTFPFSLTLVQDSVRPPALLRPGTPRAYNAKLMCEEMEECGCESKGQEMMKVTG